MKFAVVVFPGSNCEFDTHDVVTNVFGQECDFVWHETPGRSVLDGYDAGIVRKGVED